MAANPDLEKKKREAYYLQRIEALGLTPRQARNDYGLFPAPCGGILQRVKTFDGAQRTYLPEHNRRRYEQATARRSDFVLHEEAYFEPYTVKRLHPAHVTGKTKYLAPPGATLHPMPGPNATKANRTGITGGTVSFIEGYFKAVALDTNGIEATAFSGISTYRIKEDVLAYLEKRKPDRVVIHYDADAKNMSAPKDGEPFTDNRPRGFCDVSAAKFARQFFALREQINPSARLYFAMVNPDSEHKGIDDLLQHATEEEKKEILKELDTLPKRGKYIHAIRLHRTTYRDMLRKFFNLDTYRAFYEAHRQQIGAAPFTYDKRTYNAHGIGNLMHNKTLQYTLQVDPYQAQQDGRRLTVNKYLEEITAELDTELKAEGRLAIEAPTGSGKTTFVATLPKRTGQRVVVCCPTVNLTRQAAGKVRGAVALHGKGNHRKSNKAAEAQLVFCTYDTLHQLPDIHRRIVVIDEAHNLVNQYGEGANPFRADTLRKVLELSEKGQKTVFLSGTMPPLLASALGAKLLQVHRTDSNQVRVNVLEATGSAPDKITAATLAELRRIDYTADRLHFVFMNNTEHLEAIRAHLAEAGHLRAEEIELITRRTVNQGKRRGYDNIIKKEKLPDGVKLVLSTCLISEGVNINNRNIGRVLYTGNRCADTFRQYVARFRNVPALEVTAILPKENNLRERFLKSGVSRMLGQYQRSAELQVQFAEEELAAIRAEMAEEDLEHLASIEADKGTFEGDRFNLIYTDRAGAPRPDVLLILAAVREEKLKGINNAYFLQEITAAPNIELYSHAGAAVDEDTTQAVKEATAARLEAQREILAETLAELITDGPTLAKALQLYYTDTGNRKSRAELEELAAEVLNEITEIEARTYLETHRSHLEDEGARRAIRDYCKLRYLEMTEEELEEELADYDPQRIGLMWRQLQALATRHRYDNRRERTTMHHLHSLEAKADILIEKSLHRAAQADANGEGLTAAAVRKAIMEPLSRQRYDQVRAAMVTETAAQISAQKAVSIARELFELEEITDGRERRYILGDPLTFLHKKAGRNVQKSCKIFQRITPNPAKIKALSLAGRCTT